MTIKDTLIKSLDIQEASEGSTDNIKRLRRFLDCIKTDNQWQAFVQVKDKRYGKLSYEVHKFYYCTDELTEIMADFVPDENDEETPRYIVVDSVGDKVTNVELIK